MQYLNRAAALLAVVCFAGIASAQPAATTTAITSSANPSVSGQPVTFTATVTAVAPNVGAPTGTVRFFDGSNVIWAGTLDGAGQATFTTSSLFVGNHTIIAGHGNSGDSHSNSLSQTVTWGVRKSH